MSQSVREYPLILTSRITLIDRAGKFHVTSERSSAWRSGEDFVRRNNSASLSPIILQNIYLRAFSSHMSHSRISTRKLRPSGHQRYTNSFLYCCRTAGGGRVGEIALLASGVEARPCAQSRKPRFVSVVATRPHRRAKRRSVSFSVSLIARRTERYTRARLLRFHRRLNVQVSTGDWVPVSSNNFDTCALEKSCELRNARWLVVAP